MAGPVDFVLCMSINPGYSGQAFMPEAIRRIERLRAVLSRRRSTSRSTEASVATTSRDCGRPAPTSLWPGRASSART